MERQQKAEAAEVRRTEREARAARKREEQLLQQSTVAEAEASAVTAHVRDQMEKMGRHIASLRQPITKPKRIDPRI
jgi:hypothetical protein